MHPGKRLRQLREQLGLTVRDVEASSVRLAGKRGNRAYSIPLSRLSDIENKEVVPSIYRFYSLAAIYRRDIREILAWYGVDLDEMAEDLSIAAVPRTHRIESIDDGGSVNSGSSGFDVRSRAKPESGARDPSVGNGATGVSSWVCDRALYLRLPWQRGSHHVSRSAARLVLQIDDPGTR